MRRLIQFSDRHFVSSDDFWALNVSTYIYMMDNKNSGALNKVSVSF